MLALRAPDTSDAKNIFADAVVVIGRYIPDLCKHALILLEGLVLRIMTGIKMTDGALVLLDLVSKER